MRTYTELQGMYDYVSPYFRFESHLFKGDRKPKKAPEYKVFTIPKPMRTPQVLEMIDEAGYIPATVQELIDWAGNNWKDEQAVFALGSLITKRGEKEAPSIIYENGRKALHVGNTEGLYRENVCHFLAVK